jgi:translocation and assembly module TamA
MLYFISKKFWNSHICTVLRTTLCILFYFISDVALSANLINIEITGINKETKEQVLPLLSITEAKEESKITEDRVHALYQQSIREMRSILEVLGYYQADIYANLSLNQDNTSYTARYHITLGQPIVIRSLEIRLDGPGQSHPLFSAHLERWPLQIGASLNHAIYDKFKQALLAEVLPVHAIHLAT